MLQQNFYLSKLRKIQKTRADFPPLKFFDLIIRIHRNRSHSRNQIQALCRSSGIQLRLP